MPRASAGFLLQRRGQAQHGSGPQQQLLADVAEFHLSLMTAEQVHPQFLFQGLDGVGHRRLRDAQAMGREGEPAQFGHQGKDLELGKGHE